MPELSQEPSGARAAACAVRGGRGDGAVDGAHAAPRGPAAGPVRGAGCGRATWWCCGIRSSRTCWSSSGPWSGARAAGGCSGTTRTRAATAPSSATVPDELVLGRVRVRLPAAPRRVSARRWRVRAPGRLSCGRGRVLRRPVGLQALAGAVGGHVGAGGAAVGAVAPGAVGRGVQVGVAAGRRLAEAEPVDAVAR